MQAERLTMEDLEWLEESHNYLDTISEIKVFDVVYDLGGYTFYFRCTKNYHTDMGQENTIQFLEEDSYKCDSQLLEYMKDKITDIYL